MTGATKLQPARTNSINEAARARLNTNTQTQTKVEDNIKSNPLHQILLGGNATPTERKKVFAEFVAATLDKEQDRARDKAFQDFREWLSHQNRAMAQSIIELTNTGTFATLQQVIESMNSGLMDINKKMDPLNELLDSIHILNMEDTMFDAYEEIEKENELKAIREKELFDLEEAARLKRDRVAKLDSDSAALAQQRGLFGFGGVPAAAREQIARNEAEMKRLAVEEQEAREKFEALKNAPINPESKLAPDMQIHKERMREFLNLSEGRTIEQMQELVAATSNYIKQATENTTKIRAEYGDLSARLNNTDDNTSRMMGIYGIMHEGLKDAARSNIQKRDELMKSKETAGDDLLVTMDLDDKLSALDNHSKMLSASQSETGTSFANLTKQKQRVNAMKDSTNQQMDVARNLDTEGVSATSNQLASVITAIVGASISESASMVEGNLRKIGLKSDEILQKEVMRNAGYIGKISNKMGEVYEGLSTMRDTQNVASEMIRSGLTDLNSKMGELEAERRRLEEEMKQSLALHSDLAHTGDDQTAKADADKDQNSGTGFTVNFGQ